MTSHMMHLGIVCALLLAVPAVWSEDSARCYVYRIDHSMGSVSLLGLEGTRQIQRTAVGRGEWGSLWSGSFGWLVVGAARDGRTMSVAVGGALSPSSSSAFSPAHYRMRRGPIQVVDDWIVGTLRGLDLPLLDGTGVSVEGESPDGRSHIVCAWHATSDTVRVLGPGAFPSVSAERNLIGFHNGAGYSVASLTNRQMADPVAIGWAGSVAALSPDGQWVFAMVQSPEAYRLGLFSVDSGEEVWSNQHAGTVMSFPRWSASSDQVWFISTNQPTAAANPRGEGDLRSADLAGAVHGVLAGDDRAGVRYCFSLGEYALLRDMAAIQAAE